MLLLHVVLSANIVLSVSNILNIPINRFGDGKTQIILTFLLDKKHVLLAYASLIGTLRKPLLIVSVKTGSAYIYCMISGQCAPYLSLSKCHINKLDEL